MRFAAGVGTIIPRGQVARMKRTNFLAAASIAGVASLAARADAQSADAVPGGREFVERKANFDMGAFEAKLGRSADIRQLYENLAFKPGVLSNIKNSLNGFEFGFGYPKDRISIAVANHGPSSAYTYTDYVWSKYAIGKFFNITDRSGASIDKNVFLAAKNGGSTSTEPDDDKGPYQDTGIEALQARGAVFLTCHTAVEEQARALVAAGNAPAGMSASDVAADILTHLIPGAVVVPSMVATVAVLQHRFAYTYITIQS